MNKKRILLLFALLACGALVLFSACGKAPAAAPDAGGLAVNSISTALGAEGDTLDKTVLSVEVSLTNNEAEPVTVKSAQIICGENIKPRILSGGEPIALDAVIGSGETITVSDTLLLDTNGMTKEQISALEPFVRDLKIVTEQTLPLLRKGAN